MSYRVDNVPLLLKPLFWIYAGVIGLLLFLVAFGFGRTCLVKLEGKENYVGTGGVIFAYWHNNNFPSFVADFFRGKNFVAFNHPAWYMKPVHVAVYLLGVKKIILGSTGSDGRKAADEVVKYLKQGYSTFVNPDGPYGPPFMIRKGVLHMAEQSGLPIIPVKFLTSRELVLKKTWDGKRIPIPFSRIKIVYGKPLYVTKDNFDDALRLLASALA